MHWWLMLKVFVYFQDLRNKEVSMRTLALGFLLLLSSCTGSFEEGGSPIRLIISLNPNTTNQVSSIACNGQVLPISQYPGLALLDFNRLSGTSSTLECGSYSKLDAAPYQTINGAELNNVPSVFVSLPTQATVQRYSYKNPNTLTKQVVEYKYIPKLATDNPNFCPTQLTVSQDNLLLGVLDNSSDTIAKCTSNNTRLPRVIIFTIANSSLQKEINLSNFIDSTTGEISIAILNNRLYALGSFTGKYRIRRYELGVTDPNTSFITTEFANDNASSVNLSVVKSRLLVSFKNASDGRLLSVIEDNNVTPNTIRFGDELRVGTTTNDPLIGKTNQVRAAGSSGANFTLFLRPDNVLFQKDTQFAVTNLNLPLDATFPPDNSIWVLNANRLRKVDTRNFPQPPSFDDRPDLDLTGLNPGNVVWVFDENQ
jgi:hypothetical protein